MPRRPKPPISPSERLRKLAAAYVAGHTLSSAVAEAGAPYGRHTSTESDDAPTMCAPREAKSTASPVAPPKPQEQEKAQKPVDTLPTLESRIQQILQLAERIKHTPNRMLFFVMYDIESNKVRRLVSDYLERQGCHRIQRSIFLAEASLDTYQQIKHDLTEVQAAYENADSIIVLPVTTDYLRQMKVIGKHIAVDVITHTRNTLFF